MHCWKQFAWQLPSIWEGQQRTTFMMHQSCHQRQCRGGRVPNPRPQQVTQESWEQLDQINMEELFLLRMPIVEKLPSFLPRTVEVQFLEGDRERHRAMMANDWVGEESAWKLFGLVPVMLLHRPRHTGSVGRDELAKRADDFGRGKWTELIEGARGNVENHCSSADVVKDDARRRGRVRRGQVSRARHELTGTPLAPKTEATLADLRARRPQEQQRAIPSEVVEYVPGSPLQLDAKNFTKCLRTAPSRCSNETLRVCLDDVETLGLLFSAAEDFARAD